MAQGEELFLIEKSPEMTVVENGTDDFQASSKTKGSFHRVAMLRQRRLNTGTNKVFGEVYNSRGKLNDLYRRKAVNSLHITESVPEHITQLDFLSLIPNELRSDQRIVNDLVKRLSEAARHRQRIARANFIYRHEAQRLLEIFNESIHREEQCLKLAKLISDVRNERQWKGSMPSVEWFLRRKKGVVSSKNQEVDKNEQEASGPAAPNKLKRLLEMTKVSNEEELQMKIPKKELESVDESSNYTEYLKQLFLNATSQYSDSAEKQNCDTRIEMDTTAACPAVEPIVESPNRVSTTIISTEELHFANSESGLLSNTTASQTLPNSLDRNVAIEKLETYFSRSTPDQIRQYMCRLRQAANRRLAEQAVDLISVLSSEECSQFLSDIDLD
ncbi:unnamed protein product [Thelazia callipaeda]|uniref:Coiled-coil domain-containing protein n=1 Tax=Thelazia callipaeda TaxID=103827 RepID=A0A0N5D026_THECL|nr:unnamed protein product [Thelazia callipaeda]